MESGNPGESSIFLSEAEDLAAVVCPTFLRPLNHTPLLLCAMPLPCSWTFPRSCFPPRKNHLTFHARESQHESASCVPSPSENLSASVRNRVIKRLSGTASIAVNLFNSRDDLSAPSSQRDFKEPIPLFSGVIVGFLVAHLGVSKA